jgi:hypothetical protein
MTISQKQECEQVALLPCPQCGSPDIRWISGGAGNHFLNCKECLLATDDGSKERVAKRWNDRPTTVPNHVADGLERAAAQMLEGFNPNKDWGPGDVEYRIFGSKAQDLFDALSEYRKATSCVTIPEAGR